MILDELSHADRYFGLGPRFQRALSFLRQEAVASLPVGRHIIDGSEIFALVSDYETKPRASGVWEAHRRHIDIQAVFGDEELCGRTDLTNLATQPYDEEKDVLFATGTGDFFVLRPGSFATFFPHDAHMPGLAVSGPRSVRKVVVKLAVQPG